MASPCQDIEKPYCTGSCEKSSLEYSACNAQVPVDIEKTAGTSKSPFAVDLEGLVLLIHNHNTETLIHYGGVYGVAAALNTCLDSGICGDPGDLAQRRELFGTNDSTEPQYNSSNITRKLFLQLFVETIRDPNVVLLLCCAILSLVLEIKSDGFFQVGIRNGKIMIMAVLASVNVSFIFRLFRYTRLKKLSQKRASVSVIRNGMLQEIAATEIVAGELLCLKAGDYVPADAIFVAGHDFKVDDDHSESSYEDHFDRCEYPFLFTGAKVLAGECRALVVSVGKSTEQCRTWRLASSTDEIKESKMQQILEKFESKLERVGLMMALAVLLLQVMRYFTWEKRYDHDDDQLNGVKNTMEEIMHKATKIIKKRHASVHGFVAVLSILLLATRDGMALGILVICQYAAKIFMAHRATVRKLSVLPTLGLVTTLCVDEMGDLTLDHTQLADLWVDKDHIKSREEMEVHVLQKLCDGVFMNQMHKKQSENLLLCWARKLLFHADHVKDFHRTLRADDQAIDSEKDISGLMFRQDLEDRKVLFHLHWKGNPETILYMCSHHYKKDGTLEPLDDKAREFFNNKAGEYDECIAFAHKLLWLENEEEALDSREELPNLMKYGLTLIGIVGLKNPYKPELKQAIAACTEIGVKIKLMVDHVDIDTARVIATSSGILKPENDQEGAVMEASEIWQCSRDDRAIMLEKARVIANATPSDKIMIVQCLKEIGEVVAATGRFARDCALLKEADLGFSFDQGSAEAAKEKSDIVIFGTSISTLLDMFMLGRSICKNILKFIQLQMTQNMTAFTINLIVAAVSSSGDPLEPFQLLLVNLTMDSIGGVALACSTPLLSEHINLKCLISNSMWRNIISQVVFQVTVLVFLNFKAGQIFHTGDKVCKAMTFNTYVLCQIFVLVNARNIEKINLLKGTKPNERFLFLGIVSIAIIVQIAIMEVISVSIRRERLLDVIKWGICIGLATISVPIGCAVKLISVA